MQRRKKKSEKGAEKGEGRTIDLGLVPRKEKGVYEVCKLSNETGNVAFDLATLEARGLVGRQRNMLSTFSTSLTSLESFGCA